jgi:lipopolysaccharide/colanic/teichoic acid biosynthesis glycosyltransferase
MLKRTFDLVGSAIGLVALSPLLLLIGLLVKMTSRGPVLFRQERIGKDSRPFTIYKFRTMTLDQPDGSLITVGDDTRITKLGRFLRRTKADEVPQLLNILKGEMSFVGPRPEVRKYVEMFRDEYREILKVRPGITDLASLKYRDEAAILARAAQAEEEYRTRVLPDKIQLAQQYVRCSSLLFDLGLIARTLLALAGVGRT